MKAIDLDREWMFRRGWLDSLTMLENTPGIPVNLPHDGMIGTPVTPDAPAKSGFRITDMRRFMLI